VERDYCDIPFCDEQGKCMVGQRLCMVM
jgi:hypothetical protein